MGGESESRLRRTRGRKNEPPLRTQSIKTTQCVFWNQLLFATTASADLTNVWLVYSRRVEGGEEQQQQDRASEIKSRIIVAGVHPLNIYPNDPLIRN